MDEMIDRMNQTTRAYQRTFLGEDNQPLPLAKLILEDLAAYCGETSDNRKIGGDGRLDQHAVVYAAGRADVFKRIRMWLVRKEAGYDRYSKLNFDPKPPAGYTRSQRIRWWLSQFAVVWRGSSEGN